VALVLNEDQQLLKKTSGDFVKRESPISRLRQLRDTDDATGFSRQLWAQMAELGWQSILIPEEYGGLGMGYAEMACVMEECGRNLVQEPLLSTVLLGANTILLGGSDAQKSELLPQVADGSLLLALAYHETGARYSTSKVRTNAVVRGDGFTLSGEKTLVFDGHTADKLIVSARTSGADDDTAGVTLFLIDRDTPGVEVVRQTTMDLRNSAIVRLVDVDVDSGAMIGREGEAIAVLDAVIDRATVGLSAEMLGGSIQAFELTMDYLKTRKQFGVLIGTFQALKHRASEMFVELELARSAVAGACESLDAGADNAQAMVSVAKARCSDVAVLIGYESIQMHGGIGMTDEHDIGFYLKRARGSELTFGDSAFHRARFADLQGY
jgi:alkylation response protein AidB-like acyl-CoA dehydrogenase